MWILTRNAFGQDNFSTIYVTYDYVELDGGTSPIKRLVDRHWSVALDWAESIG